MQTNDDIDPARPEDAGSIGGLSADQSDSKKARGSFDLRSGKPRGEGDSTRTMYFMIGGMVLLFIVALVVIWAVVISKMNEGTTEIDESAAKRDATLEVSTESDNVMKELQEEKARQLAEEDARKAAAAKLAAQAEIDAAAGNQGKSTPSAAPSGGSQPVVKPSHLRKMASGLLIKPELNDAAAYAGDGGSSGSQAPRSGESENSKRLAEILDEQRGGQGGGLTGDSASNSRGSLSNLSGTSFTPTRAYMGPPRKYLLAHNTPTRCVLYTEIVTEQPGLVDCRLTEPLYSADGSTVLAEAGAQLNGEQTIQVGPGQVRVFTSWTSLDTQWGVRAQLNSLGAGPMGASGTEGWINRHWKERFGGAVMLSIFQDGMEALSNATQKSSGSGGYTVNNSEQNVENMASKALDSTINIQDTGHVSPGTVITVIVARDVDFSSVYINR
ncbi:TrbI/VirB10 family protein [Pseudomonas viridiflava]|uniref:TrbI/VirB10 family protein n=3 Tax=Pseudomonas viridiflava TaxID=33069 RepID=UPI000F020873|nr:TrbI/VirB10 family protein [Pseudomonas viridiflava]